MNLILEVLCKHKCFESRKLFHLAAFKIHGANLHYLFVIALLEHYLYFLRHIIVLSIQCNASVNKMLFIFIKPKPILHVRNLRSFQLACLLPGALTTSLTNGAKL